MNDGRFQLGGGPGLDGLFTSGEPAYQYMGPIDMSSIGFTESALNRVVNPDYNESTNLVPTAPFIPGEILAQKEGSVTPSSRNIAKGKRFKENAKYLNDVYELVKNLVATRHPELAKEIAPMVLTDSDHYKNNAIAWYTHGKHRITHPVWENLSRAAGYYYPKNDHVVAGIKSDSPDFYNDFYVNEMTGEQYPVVKDVVAHEVAHSIDRDLSKVHPDIWPYIVKDFYYHPRFLTPHKSGGMVPNQEIFAEYMSDAMRTDLAERKQELQDYYKIQGKFFPYKLEKGLDTFYKRNPIQESEASLDVLENRAETVARAPFDVRFYGPFDDNFLESDYGLINHLNEMRSRMYGDIARTARSEARDAHSKLNFAGQTRFDQAGKVRRAKSHLDFLDWYAPWRVSDEPYE